MDRAGASKFFLYLIGIVVLFGGLQLAKGGLYLDRHEGDALHLIEIILRMADGQWPHLDFMTPLGVAAFLPMANFVKAGFGIGTSILLAQLAFAAALILPVFHVARTRMDGIVAYAFGAAVLIMALALVHGEASDNVSISMHYNRWAWGLAFLAIPVAILPAREKGSDVVDGLILGLAMSFFILGKVTFAISFAPGLVLALLMRRAWVAMGIGLAVVVICTLIPTMLQGVAFWQAYVDDILQVTRSDIRPRAGVDWERMLFAPRFLIGNLVLVASFWVLRKGARPELGLILMVFAPGFFYVTYQNYGNDPKWLALLALLMWLTGTDMKHRVLAFAAAMLIAPSFLNMGASSYRHFAINEENYQAVFQAAPHTDVYTLTHRVNRVQERRTITFTNPQFAALNEVADKEPDIEFMGQTWPACKQELGLLGVMREMAADLRAFGLGDDARIYTADTFGSVWMFGGFEPLEDGSPWYYGALSGFENADYMLIFNCPINERAFRESIEAIKKLDDLEVKELRRNELYTLYSLTQ